MFDDENANLWRRKGGDRKLGSLPFEGQGDARGPNRGIIERKSNDSLKFPRSAILTPNPTRWAHQAQLLGPINCPSSPGGLQCVATAQQDHCWNFESGEKNFNKLIIAGQGGKLKWGS